MRILYTVIITLLILFIITFSLENVSVVPLKYYDIFNTNMPVYMTMFIAFLAGVILTGLMGAIERFNLTRTIRQLNKIIRDLRRELRTIEPSSMVDDKKEDNPKI